MKDWLSVANTFSIVVVHRCQVPRKKPRNFRKFCNKFCLLQKNRKAYFPKKFEHFWEA